MAEKEYSDEVAYYAFTAADHESRGYIAASDLAIMLGLHGIQMKERQVKEKLAAIDSRYDPYGITFSEFREFLDASPAAIQRAFGEAARKKPGTWLSRLVRPRWRGILDTPFTESSWEEKRFRLGQFIESTPVQLTMLILIVIDAIAIIAMLLLDITEKSCYKDDDKDDEGRRLFAIDASSAAINSHRYLASDSSSNHGVDRHELHDGFHWLSVSILSTLLFQQILLMVAYGKTYFTKPLFVIDFVVISAALILDFVLPRDERSVATILLAWRAFRIIQSIAEAYEIEKAYVARVAIHQLQAEHAEMIDIITKRSQELTQSSRLKFILHDIKRRRGIHCLNPFMTQVEQRFSKLNQTLEPLTEDEVVEFDRRKSVETRNSEADPTLRDAEDAVVDLYVVLQKLCDDIDSHFNEKIEEQSHHSHSLSHQRTVSNISDVESGRNRIMGLFDQIVV